MNYGLSIAINAGNRAFPSPRREERRRCTKLLVERRAESTEGRIFVCDDNADTVEFLRWFIDINFKLDVVTFSDGADLLTHLQSAITLPRLLILDVVLPRVDGEDVMTVLRQFRRFDDLPVILISGQVVDVARRAYHVGAETFLEKPFDLGDLKAKIGRYLPDQGEAPR